MAVEIIRVAVHDNSAGAVAAHDVANYPNNIDNVMNMQLDAHASYDNLEWGIEANEQGREVKYIFRSVPTNPYQRTPWFTLREGDEIQFVSREKDPKAKRSAKDPYQDFVTFGLLSHEF